MKTTVIPPLQAREVQTWCAARSPRTSARSALTSAVTGWWVPMACSQPGIVSIGTNALEEKTSRNVIGTPADSGSPISRPRVTKTQHRA